MTRSMWIQLTPLFLCAALPACPGAPDPVEPTTGGSTAASSTSEPTTGEPFDGIELLRIDEYLPIDAPPVVLPADPQGELPLVVFADDVEYAQSEYDGAGTRRFAGVPEGEYLLRSESPPDPGLPGTPPFRTYIHTALRSLDYGGSYAGRADVTSADAPTTALVLDVGGMTSLQEGDAFQIHSHGADALATFDPSVGLGGPQPGALALSGWSVPWNSTTVLSGRGGVPLVDPGLGDAPQLAHLVRTPLVATPTPEQFGDPWTYAVIERLIESTPLTMSTLVSGSSVAAAGEFAPSPAVPVALDLRLGEFYAELARLSPAIGARGCSVEVYREPGVDTPIIGMFPRLAATQVESRDIPVDPTCYPDEFDMCDPVACPDGCNYETALVHPDDRVLDLEFGDPYTFGTRSLSVGCYTFLAVTHPVTGTNELLAVDVSIGARLDDVTGGPIVPRVGAPEDLRIDGKPATADVVVAGIGVTPTLSFAPSAIGAPDHYVITVRTVEDVLDGEGNPLSRRRAIARIFTESTSVQIPAGLLDPGSYYYFQVQAVVGGTLQALARATGHAVGRATAATGLVTP
jgi:hypothetical protein